MVKGKRGEKGTVGGIKQTVPSCGCAFENLWTRGVCVSFCGELNPQYLQGSDSYLVCSM